MPTYEYRCKSCGQQLEVVQSFTDDALTECPACGGTLRKVFGSIGVTFKGSGFYKTDNRSGAKSAKSAGSSESSGSSSSAEGGSTSSADSHSHGGHSHTHAAPSSSSSETKSA